METLGKETDYNARGVVEQLKVSFRKHIEEKKAKILSNLDLKFEKLEILTDISANVEASNRRSSQIDEEIREIFNELDIDYNIIEEQEKRLIAYALKKELHRNSKSQ